MSLSSSVLPWSQFCFDKDRIFAYGVNEWNQHVALCNHAPVVTVKDSLMKNKVDLVMRHMLLTP